MSWISYDANNPENTCGNCKYWKFLVADAVGNTQRDTGKCVFNPVGRQGRSYRSDTCGKWRESKAFKEAKAEECKQKRASAKVR